MRRTGWLWIVVCGLGVLVWSAGCGLVDQHEKTFDRIGGMGAELEKRMPIGMSQVQISAHGNNPGVRLSAGVEYYVEGRYVGLDGAFMAAAAGDGDLKSAFTDEDRQRLAEIYNDQALTEEQRWARILELLRTKAGP